MQIDGDKLGRWFCAELDWFEEYMDLNEYWPEVKDLPDLLYKLADYMDRQSKETIEEGYCVANDIEQDLCH